MAISMIAVFATGVVAIGRLQGFCEGAYSYGEVIDSTEKWLRKAVCLEPP
jgi:hypothetical protein